jgi:K+-transporting ATPase KdpF subunit
MRRRAGGSSMGEIAVLVVGVLLVVYLFVSVIRPEKF